MEEDKKGVELKQVIGALLFAAKHPVKTADLRKILKNSAENQGESAVAFVGARDSDISAAIDELKDCLAKAGAGICIVEVAGGYKFQTDPACGPWIREMLSLGKPARLSHPALETLAIIAYRQPVMKSEVESVRGVNVDAMVKNLLELQLVKITGRSELPGRPLLYGTTQKFLEHFGLSSLNDLPGVEQLARRQIMDEGRKREEAAADSDKEEQAEELDNDANGAASDTDNDTVEPENAEPREAE